MDNYLNELSKKHDRQIAKMRLRNKLDIEKEKIGNELKLEKLESQKSQLNTNREIKKLSNLVKQDTLTRRAGYFLKFWAIAVTITSTIISICGGYNDYSKNILTLMAFTSAIILLQFTVFIIASQETRIKKEFFSHEWKCNILKYSLLVISIYSNYRFFQSEKTNTFITLLLCISIDLIAVFLVGLAYDQITLNINNISGNGKGKIIDFVKHRATNIKGTVEQYKKGHVADSQNLTHKDIKEALNNLKNDSDYKLPVEQHEKRPTVNLQKLTHKTVEQNEFTIDDVIKYINFMYEHSKNNISVGQARIRKETGLTVTQVRGIHFYLIKKGILKSNNKKTTILVDKNKATKILNNMEVAI